MSADSHTKSVASLVVIENGVPLSPVRRKQYSRAKLNTLDGLAVELAKLYRRVDAGELQSDEANRRAWLLRQVAATLAEAELERVVARVTALEMR